MMSDFDRAKPGSLITLYFSSLDIDDKIYVIDVMKSNRWWRLVPGIQGLSHDVFGRQPKKKFNCQVIAKCQFATLVESLQVVWPSTVDPPQGTTLLVMLKDLTSGRPLFGLIGDHYPYPPLKLVIE